ncbi:CarD family transcriptional regulator [Clostridium sp. DJ247]|uniref:CarD family transcriptional regulator n=1 Tax=Clostridium sp. DJ247 TaxID=2726188 RepID=UPI00162A19B0|nr:CarD family transcriptional regulator [Clostridium sp. DJ247]MBC2582531.1 transcriptional regulator [Clostridium sp. DJ247]
MRNNGQKVFVPNYGAGIMTNVEHDNRYNANKKYISVSFLLNDINIYIPEDKLGDYRIRKIATKKDMNDALKIVNNVHNEIEKKWSKRYRQNNDKINSGNLFELCEVIRDLYYLESRGGLPPGERKILYRAESMLASEMALVFNITIEESFSKIRNLSK